MFERFTKRARAVVVLAQEEARDRRATLITSEHLLRALLDDPGSLANRVLDDLGASAQGLREGLDHRRPGAATGGLDESEVEALRSIGIDAAEVIRRVETELGARLEETAPWTAGHIPFGRDAKKVLELALREAVSLKHKYIGTEHVLLGLIRAGGLAADVLHEQGGSAARIGDRVGHAA
jgi:ATP-dependent Clp protease ATP-binding subunit ClpA